MKKLKGSRATQHVEARATSAWQKIDNVIKIYRVRMFR
jgi:hypothetical protein